MNACGLLIFPCADGEKETEMSELKKLIESLIEATLEGDAEKYMSLVSERTVEMIETIGGIGPVFEAAKIALDIMGEKTFREMTWASIDQYKVVDGKLEHVSAQAFQESEIWPTMAKASSSALDMLIDLNEEDIEEARSFFDFESEEENV